MSRSGVGCGHGRRSKPRRCGEGAAVRDGERGVAAIRPTYAGGHDYVSYAEFVVEGPQKPVLTPSGRNVSKRSVEGRKRRGGTRPVGNGEDVVAA